VLVNLLSFAAVILGGLVAYTTRIDACGRGSSDSGRASDNSEYNAFGGRVVRHASRGLTFKDGVRGTLSRSREGLNARKPGERGDRLCPSGSVGPFGSRARRGSLRRALPTKIFQDNRRRVLSTAGRMVP
jgi:hypothetical protein